MSLLRTALAAGILGTIAMDALNHLAARSGLVLRIDVAMIGRMAAGWARGRFVYRHPDEMRPVAHETLLGYLAHFVIGIVLATVFVLAWDRLIGGPISPAWTLIYGVATTAASVFLVYPAMGLGILGLRSPAGLRAPLSSLANHLFFGVGMAIAVALA